MEANSLSFNPITRTGTNNLRYLPESQKGGVLDKERNKDDFKKVNL